MNTQSLLLAISLFINFITISHIKQLENSPCECNRGNSLSIFIKSTLTLWYLFIGMQILQVKVPPVVSIFTIVLVIAFDACMYLYTKEKIVNCSCSTSMYTHALYLYHALNLLGFFISICALTVIYIFRPK